jgi:hypothetical protein
MLSLGSLEIFGYISVPDITPSHLMPNFNITLPDASFSISCAAQSRYILGCSGIQIISATLMVERREVANC